MTDATVDQQGESKRRREHPAVDSSGSSRSNSSETSTDTEMNLVDVCVRFSVTIPRQRVDVEGVR